MESIESKRQAWREIVQTIIVPVFSGLVFFLWLYNLLKSQPPKVLVFPLSSLIFFLLYTVSGPIYGGVLLSFITVVGFLGIVLTDTNLYRLLFFAETLWLWGMFFLLEYYSNTYHDQQNQNREKEDTLDTKIALLESQLENNRHRCVNLTQRIANYQSLGGIIQVLSSSLQEEKIVPLVTELAFKFIGRGDWKIKKGIRNDPFAQYVKMQQLPLIVQNVDTDNRFVVRHHSSYRSLIAVPLEVNGKFWGVIKGVSPKPDDFDESDLRLLSVLGGIASLVLNNARLYQKTQELAITDGLTGLYVQNYFKERLAEELQRARGHQLPMSVAILDIDFFKTINDTYGHAAGDVVLRQVAALLRRRLRETDFISRYGGEEFGIIMPQTDTREGTHVVEEIRKSMEDEKFFLPVESFHPVQAKITVSIGLASLSDGVRRGEDLLGFADGALYRAKHNGRNRVEVN